MAENSNPPGSMQSWPLLVTHALEYAARWHKDQEIVCKTVEGPVTISTYADLNQRAKLCALALQKLGVKPGDVVGTLAWNTTRHLEAWYGTMGIGGVTHTLNPRLSDADIAYIAGHGEDRLILVDATLLPVVARIAKELPLLQAVVVLTDRQHMPDHAAAAALSVPLLCYEQLLDEAAESGALGSFTWPRLHEDSPAGLCYTSGTTGNPKGVRYTHRSNFLHALITTAPDALALSASSTILMVVPMFHANSWGLNFSGVSSVHVVVPMFHANSWGLNFSAGGSTSQEGQGRPHLFCDMRLVDDEGKQLPNDGKAVGHLQVRGPIVVERYHKAAAPAVDDQGWFMTGDVASIDEHGMMRIADRSKDVIKSGGEWISSIALENACMGHPKVLEAAVVGIPDEKWGERPLLVVVPHAHVAGDEALKRELLAYMAEHPAVARYAAPDDVAFVPEIPHNATGKVSKLSLRMMFQHYKRPSSKL
uniref:AMP-dependent synthetase/ligase domain-containing protein n=1 Tax=Tetradesmus obliquus TaxID=3088 RepID=A0A383WNB5_TETOB|eukprot:jgi/Sobl393_1/13816/SZX78935.1